MHGLVLGQAAASLLIDSGFPIADELAARYCYERFHGWQATSSGVRWHEGQQDGCIPTGSTAMREFSCLCAQKQTYSCHVQTACWQMLAPSCLTGLFTMPCQTKFEQCTADVVYAIHIWRAVSCFRILGRSPVPAYAIVGKWPQVDGILSTVTSGMSHPGSFGHQDPTTPGTFRNSFFEAHTSGSHVYRLRSAINKRCPKDFISKNGTIVQSCTNEMGSLLDFVAQAAQAHKKALQKEQ